MHTSHLLGAALICAGIGLFFTGSEPATKGGTNPRAEAGTTAVTVPVPAADGHLVLVLEGDHNLLDVTHASRKTDPWAGVQKGLRSEWTLSIRDASGAELALVPLDMSQFDLAADRVGQPLQVQGCVVRDTRIAMLASVPSFAAATSYVFRRGDVTVGAVEATKVNQLAGGGR